LQVYDESQFGSNPIIAAAARGHGKDEDRIITENCVNSRFFVVPAVVFLLSSGGAANQADLEKRSALHHAGTPRD
jgi:hypothetical protein